MSRHDTTIFSLHFWQMLQKLSRQLRKGQSTLYTSVLVGPYYDLTWTHAAHDLLPVHHAERRVGLVLELHLVYSALLLLLLRRITIIG
jgi:hypothetical protein